MRFKSILIQAYLFLFYALSVSAQSSYTNTQGTLDLSDYDFYSNSPIKLNGEWFFAWKKFSHSIDSLSKFQFINVPGSWSKFTQKTIPEEQFGYCTYGLIILLPDSGKQWALRLPSIHSAYKLYIDEKLVAISGVLAKDASMIPEARTQIVHFVPLKKRVAIVLEVSNFHFSFGGIWSPIEIGSKEAINRQSDLSMIVSSFLIGSLLIMGLYHLALFALWKENKSPLYFAVVCFFLAIRESFAGEAIFYTIFSGIGYEWSIKLLYATFPCCMISFVLFLERIYPKFSRRMIQVALVVSVIYLGAILFTKNTFYGGFLFIISLLFVIESIYWLYVIIRHFKENRGENILVLFGVIVLIVCTVNDLLFEAGKIDSFFMLPLGFFVFILCQSILLSIRFSNAFKEKETLGLALIKSNHLRQVEEIKNRFFSNITHEFRTPLTLIISPVEKLLNSEVSPALLKRALNTIHKNGIGLLRLINQLLDLSKLEAGNMKVTAYTGDLKRFFGDVIESFKLFAEEKNITLHYKCHDVPVEAAFDAEKFEKILFNLLSNAIKFSHSDSFITIELTRPESVNERNSIVLSVEDSGIGIPQDKLANIFERFFQVDDSATRTHDGTGIGLSLVKELTDLLRGSISVVSELGKGTTFTVELPIETIKTESSKAIPDPKIRMLFSGIDHLENSSPNEPTAKILVVEDNLELLEYITQDLSLTYDVITATDGQQAWLVCQHEMPDLVVSDIMMPLTDGFELCRLIKESETTNHIGVILLTAKAASENKIKGLSLGANDYLPKPFHYEELGLRIKNILLFQRTLRKHYCHSLTKLPSLESKIEVENPFLKKVFYLLDKHLDNSDLSIEFLASELAMSSRTLNRKLSVLVGLSPNTLVRNYRLKKGAELLQSGCNVSETAYRIGFESPSYFGICFKELFSVTPSEYTRI